MRFRLAGASLFCAISLGVSGCGIPSAAPSSGFAPRAVASQPEPDDTSGYKVIYTFTGGSKPELPRSGLLPLNGQLYGTSVSGGNGCGPCGTVFVTSPSGRTRVLLNFDVTNGYRPFASLIALEGKLYGTTSLGGKYAYTTNAGTVFSLTTSGQQKILVNFNDTNGDQPMANLVALDGVLYGTTEYGGKWGDCYNHEYYCGTVFKVTPSGKHALIHSFHYTYPGKDGYWPTAGLVPYEGALYGTTTQGGTHDAGTVYSITPAGKERVVYSFAGGNESGYPSEGLVVYNKELYGATLEGGPYREGAIFAVTPSGKERIVYAFGGASEDGAFPNAVTLVNGRFYGTTISGGAHLCGDRGYGCGTVFSLTPSGTETVLHSFAGGKDGLDPVGALTEMSGSLYGVTNYGGTGTCYLNTSSPGCGTIFTLHL